MTSNIRSPERAARPLPAGVPEPRRRGRRVRAAHPRAARATIVELQLARLRERLAERRIELEVTDAAKELLAEEGWDPAYGARPLKRAIQRLVENPLALELLEGRFGEGDTVRVDAADGELVFEPVGVAETVQGLSQRRAHGRPHRRVMPAVVVGRDAELAPIRDFVTVSPTERRRSFSTGEAGIGKVISPRPEAAATADEAVAARPGILARCAAPHARTAGAPGDAGSTRSSVRSLASGSPARGRISSPLPGGRRDSSGRRRSRSSRKGGERWLVAPYGDRNWVKNARAAGWVELRRGRRRERLAVEELAPADAVPVLREYYRATTRDAAVLRGRARLVPRGVAAPRHRATRRSGCAGRSVRA